MFYECCYIAITIVCENNDSVVNKKNEYIYIYISDTQNKLAHCLSNFPTKQTPPPPSSVKLPNQTAPPPSLPIILYNSPYDHNCGYSRPYPAETK